MQRAPQETCLTQMGDRLLLECAMTHLWKRSACVLRLSVLSTKFSMRSPRASTCASATGLQPHLLRHVSADAGA